MISVLVNFQGRLSITEDGRGVWGFGMMVRVGVEVWDVCSVVPVG